MIRNRNVQIWRELHTIPGSQAIYHMLTYVELSPIMRFLKTFLRAGPMCVIRWSCTFCLDSLKKANLDKTFLISIICSIMIYVKTANKRCLNQMEDWSKFVLIYLVFRYIIICFKWRFISTYSFLYLSDFLIEMFVFTKKEKQIQFISDVDKFLAKDFFVCVCIYTVSCVYNRVLSGLAI